MKAKPKNIQDSATSLPDVQYENQDDQLWRDEVQHAFQQTQSVALIQEHE